MLRERLSPILLLLFSIVTILNACSLFGGGAQEDRVNSMKHSKNYSITAPAGWTPIDHADSDSAYRIRSGDIVTVTSSCDRDATQSLEILTKHLLIGARKIQMFSSERIIIEGGEGLYSHVQAHLEGRPFDLHFFVITKKNCVFDFSLLSSKVIGEAIVNEFKSFFRSFKHVSQ